MDQKSNSSANEDSVSKPGNGKKLTEQEKFKEILSYIQSTDLEFVQLEKNGRKMILRRSSELITAAPAVVQAKEKEEEGPQFFSIRSPIVGRFYGSITPDRPPMVVEGGRVTAGQRVAIIEAMEIKKEVFSAMTGKVVRIFVRDGDPVEYGQELFSVELEKEDSGEK